MKILHKDLKYGEVKLTVESPEDVWYISQIVEPSDIIKGVTLRKVQATEKSADRKRVFLAIKVEKTEFTESSFRATGKIIDGPEDVPRGAYHTFNIEPNDTFTIVKSHWFSYQLDRLKEACETRAKILICCFDREEAVFALVKRQGYEILSKLKGDVAKKDLDESSKSSFYPAIIKQLEEYDKRYGLDHIIVASPAFWKDEFVKVLNNPELKKKITMATCSSVGASAVDEVLKREEISTALKQDRVARETAFVEKLLGTIAKNGPACYGMKNVENAAFAGAIDTLLVTDGLIQNLRLQETFSDLEELMHHVDAQKGAIVLVSSKHTAGKKLDGLGGIGALLRYKLSYN
ncbi:mRNA surveillance protein pelota [Candidatus Woesearchaeota archaeon]|nr:mRNA surveillance protein pelota [Candidatus Woesearchaeota archaeon]